MQLGLHPVAVVGRLVEKEEKNAIYKRRNNTQNSTKNRIHKIENIQTKQENKHKKNIKRRKLNN
jgi:hypothetical protein